MEGEPKARFARLTLLTRRLLAHRITTQRADGGATTRSLCLLLSCWRL